MNSIMYLIWTKISLSLSLALDSRAAHRCYMQTSDCMCSESICRRQRARGGQSQLKTSGQKRSNIYYIVVLIVVAIVALSLFNFSTKSAKRALLITVLLEINKFNKYWKYDNAECDQNNLE